MKPKTFKSPFRQLNDHTLELREGGGCISIFGLPFFLVGAFIVLAAVGLLPVEVESDSFGARLGMAAFGSVFACVGGVLVFGRSWVIIDKKHKRVIQQWGLIKPMHAREESLAGYDTVKISFIPGDSDTSDAYPVELTGFGKRTVAVFRPMNYGEAFSVAAFLARFLNIRVEDSARSRGTDRAAHKGALMFRDRLLKDEESIERVSRPLDARCVVDEGGPARHITVPSEGFNSWSLVALVFPCVVLWLMVFRMAPFFQQTNTPEIVQKIAFGFIGIFFITLPVLSYLEKVFGQIYGYERVGVDADGIIMEQRLGWRRHLQRLSLEDIIDIRVDAMPDDYREFLKSVKHSSKALAQRAEQSVVIGGHEPWWFKHVRRFKSKGVALDTVQGTFTFGRGISHQEARYICAWIKQSLKRSAGSPKKGNEHES